MARALLAAWIFCVVSVSATLARGIGVNWGTQASHPLHPSIVVGLLKDNGIKRVKLFDADPWRVGYLAGTDIEVMVGIANNQLKDLADSYSNAKKWVKHNITKHMRDGGVDIRYVGVGNEPFLTSYNGTYNKTTFPALQNIQKALNEAGFGDKIKATIPLNADVYESPSNKPSDGNFREDTRELMLKIIRFLSDNKSPFLVNIYPFLSLYQNAGFPEDFAFFGDGGSKPLRDKNIEYTNVFDANFDTLVWTLKKNNHGDIKILVGEIGWPTDGDIHASPKLAERFYGGFLKKMASKKGTPLRPGPMDVYLFSLLDEDMKSVAPGNFERHWGIFRYDGQPKFPIDFTGKNQDKMPVAAKGVLYQDPQWCVLKEHIKNMSAVAKEVDYACSNSDCTSLGYGCTCSNLDARGNISYAFNMYFQMQDQSVDACDFDGMAEIVKQNASRKGCLFPLEIVSAGKRRSFAYGATIFAGLLFGLFAVV